MTTDFICNGQTYTKRERIPVQAVKRDRGSVKLSLWKALLKAMNSDHLCHENSPVGPMAAWT